MDTPRLAPRPSLNRADVVAIRTGLGFTADQMASRIGVGPKHYRDVEAGAARISRVFDNAIRWVEATGGAPPADVCPACDGVGTVRPAADRPRLPCPSCGGQAVERVRVSL